MSRKTVQEQYNKVLETYLDTLDLLKEYEKSLESGIISDEQKQNLEILAAPIEASYKQWSGFLYLLNQPDDKKRLTRYEKRLQNKMKRIDINNDGNPETELADNIAAYGSLVHQLLHYSKVDPEINKQQEETFDEISNGALTKLADSEGEIEVKATLGEDAYQYYKSIYDDMQIDKISNRDSQE